MSSAITKEGVKAGAKTVRARLSKMRVSISKTQAAEVYAAARREDNRTALARNADCAASGAVLEMRPGRQLRVGEAISATDNAAPEWLGASMAAAMASTPGEYPPIYVAGVLVSPDDLIRADFLLPAVAHALIRRCRNSDAVAYLRHNRDALLGYEVLHLAIPEKSRSLAVGRFLDAAYSRQNEYEMDEAVCDFQALLEQGRADTDCIVDIDVRVALSLPDPPPKTSAFRDAQARSAAIPADISPSGDGIPWTGPTKRIASERQIALAAGNSARRSDAASWHVRLKEMAAPLPLRGRADSAVADVLDGEFPWMRAATDYVRIQLTLLASGSKGWVRVAPMVLVGPPGIGKTTWAMRLAELLDIPFDVFDLSGRAESFSFTGHAPSFSNALPGLLFRKAAEHRSANVMMVLDEIDKVPTSNYNGNMHDALLPVLEQRTAKSVVDPYFDIGFDWSECSFVATANTLEKLPDHLRSRFQVVVIGEPTADHLRGLMTRMCADIAAEYGLAVPETPPLTAAQTERLADEFQGHSNLRLIRRAIVRIMADRLSGAARPFAAADVPDARATAVHEAGHILCGVRSGLLPVKASIIPDDDGLSYGRVLFGRPPGSPTAAYLKARMVVAYGGWAAEMAVLGPDGTSAGVSQDFEQAEAIARRIVSLGMSGLGVVPVQSKTVLSTAPGSVEGEVARLMGEASQAALAIIGAERALLDRIADRLVADGELDRGQIAEMAAIDAA